MAELTIRLRRDPATGKHDILIDLKSDADALPHEHEQMHREAVEKIIGKEHVGKVIVEREDEKAPALPESSTQPERKAQPQTGYVVGSWQMAGSQAAHCPLPTAHCKQ